jgi:hypothetical protein
LRTTRYIQALTVTAALSTALYAALWYPHFLLGTSFVKVPTLLFDIEDRPGSSHGVLVLSGPKIFVLISMVSAYTLAVVSLVRAAAQARRRMATAATIGTLTMLLVLAFKGDELSVILVRRNGKIADMLHWLLTRPAHIIPADPIWGLTASWVALQTIVTMCVLKLLCRRRCT